MREIVVNHMSDNSFILKIEFLQLKHKKSNNPIQKWAKDLNRYAPKEDTQRANKQRKRLSTPLITKEMQITEETQIHNRYKFPPTRMAIIYLKEWKTARVTSMWRNRIPVHTTVEYKMVQPLLKTPCCFLKKLNRVKYTTQQFHS